MCRLESMKELLEEEGVNCTTSLEHEELNKWSHDQDKNEAEIQQTGSQKAASCQGNSYSLADDMLNYLFEMMHTSPDLFSQSLSRAKGVCSDTPYLYSSPKLLKGESRSCIGIQNILAERLTYFLPQIALLAGRKWTRYHCFPVLIIHFSLPGRCRFSWLRRQRRLQIQIRTWCVFSHKPERIWKQVCPEWWTGY